MQVTDPSKLVTQLVGAEGDAKAATHWANAQVLQHAEGCLAEWVSGGYYTLQNLSAAIQPLMEVLPKHCGNFAEYGLQLKQFTSLTLNIR